MSQSQYEHKNFTISLEEIPHVDLKILHIKKGKVTVQLCISEGESKTLTELFGIPVQPPLYEVL